MSARLVVDMPVKNWAYTLPLEERKRVTAGSAKENILCIPDDKTAGCHAEFFYALGFWFVKNSASPATTTLLNGNPIDESPLKHGDIVQVGDCQIAFQSSEAEAAEVQRVRTASILSQGSNTLRQELYELELEPQKIFELKPHTAEPPVATPSPDRPPSQNTAGKDHLWVSQKLSEILEQVLQHEGDQERTYQVMLEGLRSNVGADNGFVMIADAEGQRLIIRAHAGDTSAWTTFARNHPVPLTVAETAFREARILSNTMTGDEEQDVPFSGSMLALNVNGYIAVPLLESRKCRGVLYFDTRNFAKTFQPRDVKLLERAGSYILEIENQTL